MNRSEWVSWIRENHVVLAATGWAGYQGKGRGYVLQVADGSKISLLYVPLANADPSAGIDDLVCTYDLKVSVVYLARCQDPNGKIGAVSGAAQHPITPPEAFKRVRG
jgi:hypothetical protein